MKWQNGGSESPQGSDENIIPFGPALRRAVETQEQFLTNAERRELREMLAWYREVRPQLEAIKRSCPTARRLLEDG